MSLAPRMDSGPEVTVSVGVVERRPNECLSAALQRVERNLYFAKSSGRNTVCAD